MSSIDHLHSETEMLQVKDHLNLLSAQHLVQCLNTENVCHHITKMDLPPREMKETIFTRHKQTVLQLLANNRKDTLQALHATFVNTAIDNMKDNRGLQTTQPTSGGAVTAVTNCCGNGVEPSRFTCFILASRPCGPAEWLALLLTKVGVMWRLIQVRWSDGPITTNTLVWICDICYKQIHVRKQISIRCNKIEHWVQLRCAGIRQ